MATTHTEDHERAAAGMDFDSPIREKASKLGQALAENGPEALFEEIENLLPEGVKEQVVRFPIAAVILALGAGVWLGLRKGDEVIAAGTSLVTAAAMSNVAHVMERTGGDD